MENKEYRAWFENTRESNFKTIGQTETIFEGLVLKIKKRSPRIPDNKLLDIG